MQVQKFGGSPSKNGAKDIRKFGRFHTTSDFDREYLRNEARYPKSERRPRAMPAAFDEESPVNFGPQTTKNYM